MTVQLRPTARPDFTTSPERPRIGAQEYERRCADAYARSGTDWLVVYADREHWGNLCFLTGFDPLFEEALLLLGRGGARFLVVGNEGLIHSAVTGLEVDVVLCQTLSLMGQPRARAPKIVDVLHEVGLSSGQSVSVAGWKYLEPNEADDLTRPSFVPAYVVDNLQLVTGAPPMDATATLMHPVEGLRSTVSAAQVAAWEYSAVHAAKAVFGVIDASRPGRTEYDAVRGMDYPGYPLSAHVMFASGKGDLNGLRSPSAKVIEAHDAVTTAVGFWGGLTCRAGLVASADDDFLDKIAFPYYRTIAAWYSAISVGVSGGDVWDVVMDSLAGVSFKPLVNPGHLIGHEEWTHTPIRDGSTDVLRSGMTMQSDIIPFPLPPGSAINAEDTVVLADSRLRRELADHFPDLWERTQQRRRYMADRVGIHIREDVLPLSPTCGYLLPLWQAPALACVID